MDLERHRYPVPAGPAGLAVDVQQRRAVVWSQFAHRLTVIHLDRDGGAPATAVAGPRSGWPDERIARGRVLFHASADPRITGDARACATCHPDGREDGLSWQTPSGRHQTIGLAGRVAASEPFGWFGERGKLRAHVAQTWQRLGGRGAFSPADLRDLEALAEYLRSMPAPSRADGREAPDAALVARGRDLFHGAEQACGSCHPGGKTDGRRHQVKSGSFGETYDTPSLYGVSGTAPYFHDGRFATLEELLAKTDGAMGHTAHLAPDDRKALLAYLEAL